MLFNLIRSPSLKSMSYIVDTGIFSLSDVKYNPARTGGCQDQLALDANSREVVGRELRDSSEEATLVIVRVFRARRPH